MSTGTPFFVSGGTLPPDVPSYIERDADKALYERARRCDLCYLLTPRRSGKSSLLVRLRERLRLEGMRVAFVDLGGLGTSDDAEAWYYGFCRLIAREVDAAAVFEAWWREHEDLPSILRLSECLRYCLLLASSAPLLVMIDEIETVRRLPFGDDFLAAVRATHNARAHDPEYTRLGFVLAGVSTPGDLIHDPRRTPFNVGARVDLTDFTPVEAAVLVTGLAASCPQPDRVLAGILEWTQGHPYLTQKLCKAVIEYATAPEGVDALVETELLSPRARGSEDHFTFIRERLLTGDRARRVAALYGRVLSGERIPDDARSPVHGALRLSDLVRVDADGCLAPRNRILSTVFDRGFVRQALRRSPAQVVAVSSLAVTLMTFVAYAVTVPLGYIDAIDAAVTDAPIQEYSKLHRIPGLGGLADEHLARFFDRRALATAQSSDRDRALLFALHADTLASTPVRRAQAAALFTPDLLALRRTFRTDVAIWAVSFSPGGDFDFVATAGDGSVVTVWAVATGKRVAVISLPGPVSAVAFSPDGKRLLTTSANEAQLWDARTWETVARVKHDDRVRVAFSPDGKRLLTASANEAQLWDARTGKTVAQMKHDNHVDAVAFNPDSRRVLTLSMGGTVRLWDDSGREIGARMRHDSVVFWATFSPDGERVLTVTEDCALRLWDGRSGVLMATLGENSPSELMRIVRQGDRVLTIDELGGGRLWDTRRMEFVRWFPWASHYATLSRDGRQILVAYSDGEPGEGGISFWDTSSERPRVSHLAHAGGVASIAFSDRGDVAATGGIDGSVRLWDARGGGPLGVPMEHLGRVTDLQFSPDGSRLLSASRDGIRLWAVNGARAAPARIRHDGFIRAAAFASNGEHVITGSEDSTARLWNSRTSAPVGEALQHDDRVNAVAFSSDSRLVATASSDRTARLWDARDGRQMKRLQHRAAVLSVVFSPDDTMLLTGGADGATRLWSVRDGNAVVDMTHSPAGDAVTGVAISADGTRIAAASRDRDRDVQLWNVRTGMSLGVSLRDQLPVEAIAFSPDGKLLATTRDAAFVYASTHSSMEFVGATGPPLGSPAASGVVESTGAAVFSADSGSAWTIGGRRLVLRWRVDIQGVNLIGAVRPPGVPVGGAQGLWVDPKSAAHVRFVSAVGTTASVEDVDLASPPAGFDRPSPILERELAERLGLVLGGDGQISPSGGSRVSGSF